MATQRSTKKPRPKVTDKAGVGELFDPVVPDATVLAKNLSARTDQTWRLVTNHLNVLFMMGTGLVTGPAGFGEKYYPDALAVSPGWIPLFRERLPKTALSAATASAKHLKACVVSLDLSAVRCRAHALGADGELRECAFPEALDANNWAILIAAPLPITQLREIRFATDVDLRAFEERAKDAGNIELESVTCRVGPLPSANVDELAWPPLAKLDPHDDRATLVSAQSRGGILAMLYNIVNRSDVALAAFRVAFERQPDTKDLHTISPDPILAELPHWLESGGTAPGADPPIRLYWGVVDAIVRAKTRGTALRPIDEALRFLETEVETRAQDVYRTRLDRLIKDLRATARGLSDRTITQLFEHQKGSLSRSLLLFCLRDSCEELLEFSHPMIEDVEFVLAAILFGARDGWSGLPNNLRHPASLANFVPQHMATSAHDPGHFEFGPPPPRPVPIRELFERGEDGWSRKQQQIALDLARKLKWADCIQTEVNLGKGDYGLRVDGSGVHLLLDGDVKAVVTQANMLAFLRHIASQPLDTKSDAFVREKLSSKP